METHLTIKHVAGYLPYGLKIECKDDSELNEISYISEMTGLHKSGVDDNYGNNWTFGVKPILRPLSDLTNEDTIAFHGLGSIELELINIEEWTEELIHEIKTGQKFKLSQFEYLYSKHFDIHGLIENNLAIDINTL